MKKFSFNLDPVLEVRRLEEKAAGERLFEAESALTRINELLNRLCAEITEFEEQVSAYLEVNTSAERLRSHLDYLAVLKQKRDSIRQRLSKAVQEVEKNRRY